jgi:hypothetical protein
MDSRFSLPAPVCSIPLGLNTGSITQFTSGVLRAEAWANWPTMPSDLCAEFSLVGLAFFEARTELISDCLIERMRSMWTRAVQLAPGRSD